MRTAAFQDWLVENRGIQRNTAESYAGRAHAVEEFGGLDLDVAARTDGLAAILNQTMTRGDLGEKTRHDYATAIRAYADFCGVAGKH